MGYIDYVALVDSIRFRRERLLEEELWRCFRNFAGSPEHELIGISYGRLPTSMLENFIQLPEVSQTLSRDGIQDSAILAHDVHIAVKHGSEDVAGSSEVHFIEIVSEVIRQLPAWPSSA